MSPLHHAQHGHREAPALPDHPAAHHVPRLVLSQHHRGHTLLDRIALVVSTVVGSMWTFVAVTSLIGLWMVVGTLVGVDRPPWPLLLVVINLPQLSIMISLQVSANLAQKVSDARATADHETITALHALSAQEMQLLEGQAAILAGQNAALAQQTALLSALVGVATGRSPSPITPAMEAEADADIAAGRLTRHDDVDSLFAALDASPHARP